MRIFITLFLMLSFCLSAFGQKQEEESKPKINMLCDPSVEDMMLYIIDGVYTITEDHAPVATNIEKTSIDFIGFLFPGKDGFDEEAAKTAYPDKIRKVVFIRLTKGAVSPFETKE